MNEILKQTIAEIILDGLEKQTFADWYNKGHFDAYISGDIPPISKEVVIADIKKLFKLDR